MRIVLLLILLLTNVGQLFSQPQEILRAMNDEIRRSMLELRLPALEKPYYLHYTMTDRQQYDIKASFGSITENRHSKEKRLSVAVRVGSPQFDNTNFFDPALGFFGTSDDEERFRSRQIPFDLDYSTLRRELWLATDAAYKQTAELFAKKQAALKNRVRLDTIPDFIVLQPVKTADTSALAVFDRTHFEQMAKHLSLVFRDFPFITQSQVTLQYIPETRYFVNSEGRECIKTVMLTCLEIVATAQAKDGMPLAQTFTAYSAAPQFLPSLDSLVRAARIIGQKLTGAVSSPVTSTYSGPVLFEDQAAAEAFIQAFAPNLVTQRAPITERGISDNPRFTAFQNKIGGRVLPEFMNIDVLPGRSMNGSTPLIGSYKIDDDGVPAETFTIVKNGYLKALMSSRTPTRRVRTSNGHNREGAAIFSVLEVSAHKQRVLSAKKLREKMLQLCKDRELPYGMIVRKVLNQNILYYNLYALTDGEFPFARGEGQLTGLEVYRLYSDGREELVRGCEIAGLTAPAFKDIIAVGDKKMAYNCLAQAVTMPFFTGGSQFVSSSVILPALLFEDLEIKPVEDDFTRPPLLSHPFFSNKK